MRPAPGARRDLYVDLVRVVALAMVVLGHWVVAAVEVRDGAVVGRNLLAVQPAIQPLTWLFQVVPLFFVVGGFAHGASWSAAHRDGLGYGPWLQWRIGRLVGPVLVLALAWTAGSVLARLAGADPGVVRQAGRAVGFPLWFLAVYLLVVTLAPAMVVLQRRIGLAALVALALAVALVDVGHWGLDLPLVGWANFVVVFLFAHQLGCAWGDGSLDGRRTGWWLVGLGLAALVLLTQLGGYPVSVVGVAGAARNNNDPPSLALVALASAQVGVALLVRRRAETWLHRAWVAGSVRRVDRAAMTVFLWHFPALVWRPWCSWSTFPLHRSPLSGGGHGVRCGWRCSPLCSPAWWRASPASSAPDAGGRPRATLRWRRRRR